MKINNFRILLLIKIINKITEKDEDEAEVNDLDIASEKDA